MESIELYPVLVKTFDESVGEVIDELLCMTACDPKDQLAKTSLTY